MRELFEIQAGIKGLSLDTHHTADVVLVYADELRLRQILVNLLSNAIRYTSEGRISLLCRRQGDGIEFCVQDTGKGIAERDMEHIFQPFARVNPGTERGAGLGLTISRQLVAAMHGELSVQSKPGKGSTFRFTLPLPEEDDLVSVETLEGLNVLLVEDDDDTREMYRIWLEDWGVRIRTVPGVVQAIAAFEESPVDLVLTDLFLEDGNGMELLTVLREIQPSVATVMCSGSGSDSIKALYGGQASAVDRYVSKPVSAKRLESVLQSTLRQRRRS